MYGKHGVPSISPTLNLTLAARCGSEDCGFPIPERPRNLPQRARAPLSLGDLLGATAKSPERIIVAILIAIGIAAWLVIIAMGCLVLSIVICINKSIEWALTWWRRT